MKDDPVQFYIDDEGNIHFIPPDPEPYPFGALYESYCSCGAIIIVMCITFLIYILTRLPLP